MSKNGTTDTKAHTEQLMREAVALFEQGRLEEALLACEGALALDECYAPALSLKGLIHERRGQITEAMAAYERVQALNPLSVAERARLDALRRQARAAVRPAPTRPLWVETLPVALAFLGVGITLLIGFVLVVRWSVPPTPAPKVEASEVSPTTSHASTNPPPTSVPTPPAEPPQSSQPQAFVPPVTVDPSRLALAPAEPAPPRGQIPTLPAPEPDKKPASKPETPQTSNRQSPDADLMPDVKVEETQRGVYEIRVERAPAPSSSHGAPRAPDTLTQAQNLQRAGNYREAIQLYLQALPTAPNPAEVHQQIAISYLRLGERANARTHFQQAILEYERQIQAGRDVETARQGIAACQNGLLLCNE
ncbi:MAG: tetratricopeptide repeat protein [Fimbriimonadales bacterium]